MTRIVRKTAVAAAVIAMVGIVGLPSAAEADTGWSWRIVHSNNR